MPFKDRAPIDYDIELELSRELMDLEDQKIPFSPGASWETAEIILMSALSVIAGFGCMWIYDLVIR